MTATDATPDTTRKRRRRYNWNRIRAEYVEGIADESGRLHWPTLDDVAARNNAYPTNVRAKAAAEGWGHQREQFQVRLDQERSIERGKEIAQLGADLDLSALRVAKNGLAITAARIQELGQQATDRARALQVARQNGNANATIPPPVDSDELGVLSRAATTWHTMGRTALGIDPTMQVNHTGSVQLEAEVDLTVTERDEVSLTVLAILADAKVLPDGVVDSRDVLDVAGGGALPAGADPDAEDEPVYPSDADDVGEPEPEATGVPRARSA